MSCHEVRVSNYKSALRWLLYHCHLGMVGDFFLLLQMPSSFFQNQLQSSTMVVRGAPTTRRMERQ